MTIAALRQHPNFRIQSPISTTAFVILILMASAYFCVAWMTDLRIDFSPPILLFVMPILIVDLACYFIPLSRIVKFVHTVCFGLLFTSAASLAGIFAAYGAQRLGAPLQDASFAAIDRFFGLDWLGFLLWTDKHPMIAQYFRLSYETMGAQIALPVIFLAFTRKIFQLRVYLLAYVLCLALTNAFSGLFPAFSPFTSINPQDFSAIRFSGHTPIDHLILLREPGPLLLRPDKLGGIICFPSFHASVAFLTPYALRKRKWLLIILAPIEFGLLMGTVTEGGHYCIDCLGGLLFAWIAYFMAARLTLSERRNRNAIRAFFQRPTTQPAATAV